MKILNVIMWTIFGVLFLLYTVIKDLILIPLLFLLLFIVAIAHETGYTFLYTKLPSLYDRFKSKLRGDNDEPSK